MERFWRDFTWSVVNMDLIVEVIEGGLGSEFHLTES